MTSSNLEMACRLLALLFVAEVGHGAAVSSEQAAPPADPGATAELGSAAVSNQALRAVPIDTLAPLTVTRSGGAESIGAKGQGTGEVQRLVFSPDAKLLAVEGVQTTAFFRLSEETITPLGYAARFGAVVLPDENTAVGLPADPEWRWMYRSEVVRLSLDDHSLGKPTISTSVRFNDGRPEPGWEWGREFFGARVELDLVLVRLSPDARFMLYDQNLYGGNSRLRVRDFATGQLTKTELDVEAIDAVLPALFLLESSDIDMLDHLLLFDARTGQTVRHAAPPDNRELCSDAKLTEAGDILCLTVDAAAYKADKPVPRPQTFRLDRFTAKGGWTSDGLEFVAEDDERTFSRPLAVSSDGLRVAIGKTDDVILVGTKRAAGWAVREIGAGGKVVAMAFSPKGTELAYATAGGTSVVLENASLQP